MLRQFNVSYLGAFRYRYRITKRKIKLGIQAAINGGKLPFVAKMVEKRSVMINNAAIIKPTARCIPLPPRTFRPPTMAPIIVSSKTVTQVASRL
jgi:hypothetical protein